MTTATDTAAPGAATPTRKVDSLLARYGESHTQPVNELIHFVAIPLIVFSLLGVLYWVHPNLALVVVAASLVYYARLSIVFTATMALLSALMLYGLGLLGSWLLPLSIAIFVVSWIFQFIGHKIEGKKPSFLEDLQYLLVGPLFVLSKLFLKLGIRW